MFFHASAVELSAAIVYNGAAIAPCAPKPSGGIANVKLTYHQFLKTELDLSPLGLTLCEQSQHYFCTPKGARVFGVTGVDGIHFCFVRGFGETVFAVSPMNGAESCVHPVAKSFQDFLRLLLSCHDVAAIEQVWQWSAAQLDAFEKRYPPNEAQRAVLACLQKQLKLRPMAEPWKYIHTVQTGFDYTKLRFTEDYYDAACLGAPKDTPWQVFFEGGFSGSGGRPGKELSIRKRFDWDDDTIYIPAVYSCAKGLVVDLARRVSAQALRAFTDKWKLSPQNDGSDFPEPQYTLCQAENPLALELEAAAQVNGRPLRQSHGFTLCYNPLFSQAADDETRRVLRHYALDAEAGWCIHRLCFPWQTTRKPRLSVLSLQLRARRARVPGPLFQAAQTGSAISFTHPQTGAAHTLRVLDTVTYELPQRLLPEDAPQPLYTTLLSYDITPALPRGAVRVQDTAPSLRLPRPQSASAKASSAAAIGIIGGADGPAALASGNHTACASLRQTRECETTWQLVFYVSRREPLSLQLLG